LRRENARCAAKCEELRALDIELQNVGSATVFGVSASGWGEDTLTFNNRPPASTTALGTVDVTNTFETAYDFNVTDLHGLQRTSRPSGTGSIVSKRGPDEA